MSEIRAAGQPKQAIECTDNPGHPFIAARLPLMDHAVASEDSTDGGVTLPEHTAPHQLMSPAPTISPLPAPPILTTTNTYVFPKNFYNIICPPLSIWPEYARYAGGDPVWRTSQDFVFPKLTMPGQDTASDSNWKPMTICDSTADVVAKGLIPSGQIGAARPSILDLRGRSSTKNSFDSKFRVETATLRSSVLPTHQKYWNDTNIGSWSLPMQGQSSGQKAFVDCTPGCSHVPATEAVQQEEDDVDQNMELQAMVDWICEDLEAQALPLHKETESLASTASSMTSSQSSISIPSPVSQFRTLEPGTTATERTVPSSNNPCNPTCDSESEGELIPTTAEQENEITWSWEDDIWESVSPTPATEVEDMFGLWYDIWESS